MILANSVKIPDWISHAEINVAISKVFMLPGDNLYLTIHGRDLLIRCRGVWTSCFCFRIAGHTVREIKDA